MYYTTSKYYIGNSAVLVYQQTNSICFPFFRLRHKQDGTVRFNVYKRQFSPKVTATLYIIS